MPARPCVGQPRQGETQKKNDKKPQKQAAGKPECFYIVDGGGSDDEEAIISLFLQSFGGEMPLDSFEAKTVQDEYADKMDSDHSDAHATFVVDAVDREHDDDVYDHGDDEGCGRDVKAKIQDKDGEIICDANATFGNVKAMIPDKDGKLNCDANALPANVKAKVPDKDGELNRDANALPVNVKATTLRHPPETF